ncbi:MAG: hypothetical protein QOH81_2219 [Sphingomonadales bacterium]|jgi:hypothetical protein|nr:hypothetical protein [Sphingomonadales bacterium]
MGAKLWFLAPAAAVLLGGCDRQADENSGPARHGRYVGIGVFGAGDLWQHMAIARQASAAKAATIADDEHIIVVVDSDTGEIRECGDLTGYCVSMNPWTRALAPEQKAPVALGAHAAELIAAANDREKPPAQHR